VVIAIIGVLVALLLPAFPPPARRPPRPVRQQSEESRPGDDQLSRFQQEVSARRGLRQQRLSTTTSYTYRDASPIFWGTTWAISILPQLEQQNLFNQWNSSAGYANQRQVTGTPLAIMKCPSDITAVPAVDFDSNLGTFDKGNYGLCFGGGSSNENGNSINKGGPGQAVLDAASLWPPFQKSRMASLAIPPAFPPTSASTTSPTARPTPS